MSVNTKSPIDRGQNNCFGAKAPNNLYLNNKTIKTPINNQKISFKTTNPKTYSTPQLTNIPDQTSPNQTPPNLKKQ